MAAISAQSPVIAFDVEGDRITRFWAMRNPEKLRPWTAGRPARSEKAGPRQ
jgi:RNA polymerase sigma-70 factor (ECF subfamily)